MAPNHPTLENDAIQEAVFEIRFERSTKVVPEIFFGKISDYEDWSEYGQVRLPLSEIPESIRRSDPGLQHKPVIELVSPDGKRAIRIGPDVLIASRRGNYPGWEGGFRSEIQEISKRLFDVQKELAIRRLGMRYINALRSDLHGINSCDDLEMELKVADTDVSQDFSLNFRTNVGTDFEAMNRVATVKFAAGSIPENTTVVLDIDVHTSDGFQVDSYDGVIQWAEKARTEKNDRFFSVLGQDATERLRKK